MLTLENISKSFNSKNVLKGINVTINKNDRIALLGANGAGKSTMIKIISGEIHADTGNINMDINPHKEIGIMPQDDILIDDLKVQEIVKMKLAMNKISNSSVEYWLDKVNLKQKKTSFVDSLSGGQKRRLSLVLSMLSKPELLILDEPTTGMDLESVDDFWNVIQEYSFTSLIVTHDFNQIDNYFNRVLILKDGFIVSDDLVENIHNQGMSIEQHYRLLMNKNSKE